MKYLLAFALLLTGCAVQPKPAIDVSEVDRHSKPTSEGGVYLHVPNGYRATLSKRTDEEEAEVARIIKRAKAGVLPSIGVSSLIHNLGDLQKQPSKCTCFDCQCKTTPDNPLCNCGICQCDEPKSKPITAYIEFHTSENCGYCQQWKQTELPRLTANGWKTGDNGHIRIINHGANYEISLPLFKFFWHGKLVHQHTGYLTRAEIGAVFESFKLGREVIQSRAARVPHEAVYRGARRPLAVTFAGCGVGGCR